jgi:hypothetical protein
MEACAECTFLQWATSGHSRSATEVHVGDLSVTVIFRAAAALPRRLISCGRGVPAQAKGLPAFAALPENPLAAVLPAR